MRVFIGVLLAGLAATDVVGPPDAKDELFAPWTAAQKDFKSLDVEFKWVKTDLVERHDEAANGRFRMIRTPNGEYLASYELRKLKADGENKLVFEGWLCDRTVYGLDHQKNVALRISPPEGRLLEFLSGHFNPAAALVDRTTAEKLFQVEVVKTDDHYCYATMNPSGDQKADSIVARVKGVQAVFMTKATANVPKNMLRQIAFKACDSELYKLDITSWRLNGETSLKVSDFVKPEDRPGWRVSDWTSLVFKANLDESKLK